MELLHLALEPRAKCNNSTARAIILTNALHSVHYPYHKSIPWFMHCWKTFHVFCFTEICQHHSSSGCSVRFVMEPPRTTRPRQCICWPHYCVMGYGGMQSSIWHKEAYRQGRFSEDILPFPESFATWYITSLHQMTLYCIVQGSFVFMLRIDWLNMGW